MESKYDQLTKLKSLLDTGVLTPEEFDAAKKRILDSDISPEQSQPAEPQAAQSQPQEHRQEPSPAPRNVGYTNQPPKKNPKWIILGAIGAFVVILVIIALSGGKESTDSDLSDSYNSDDEMMDMADTVALVDYDYADISDDGLTIGNPWSLAYFKNEWGEEDKSQPMIYATLQATGWDIHIDYQLPDPSSTASCGAFRFYLLDDDGRKTTSYDPVTILVRGSDGETRYLQVTGTRDGITFVEDPANVAGFMEYLNNESFDIRMEFSKYNERHATQARWEATPGSFNEAVERLLK